MLECLFYSCKSNGNSYALRKENFEIFVIVIQGSSVWNIFEKKIKKINKSLLSKEKQYKKYTRDENQKLRINKRHKKTAKTQALIEFIVEKAPTAIIKSK